MNKTEREIFNDVDVTYFGEMAKERLKAKRQLGDITDEEYNEKFENVVRNTKTGRKLKNDIMKHKQKKMKRAEEQYANDEISEEELDRRMDELFENGDDFLDYNDEETTGERVEKTVENAESSIMSQLKYYAFPICVLAPILFVILVPGVNPMIGVVGAPSLLLIGALLYIYFEALN